MSVSAATTQLMSDLAAALTETDWQLCRRAAQSARGTAFSAFQELRAGNLQRRRRLDRAAEAARLGAIVEAATGSGPSDDSEAFLERLTAGLQDGAPAAYETGVISLYSRAMQAAAQAAFNTAYLAALDSEQPVVSRFVLQMQLDALAEDLDAGLRSLFAASVERREALILSQQALSFAAEIELLLEPLCANAARLERSIEQLFADGRGTEAETSGRLATDHTAVIRTAIALHAACLRFSLDLASPAPDNDGKALVAAAPDMTFDGELPDGLNAELHRIGEIEDGRLIEVRGSVVSREAFRDGDGKLVTRAVIRDPSSDAEITLAGVFAHWAHSGMTPGAFVHATGSWRTSSVLNSDDPALEVTQLPLADMADSTWRHAMLWLGSRWFPRWRNELQIDWSMSPHLAGNGDTPPRQGAVELIFLSIVRPSP